MLIELSVMEQRYQAVMEVLQARTPVTDVAKRYGVSRQSVHGWVKRYRAEGIGALANRTSVPRWSPKRLDPTIEAAICELRRSHPRWGPRTLAYWLEKAGTPAPARSTIYRVLVRNDLIVPVTRGRRRDSYIRWERSVPMELWQHDLVAGVVLKSGRKLNVLTGVDDHSRYCVCAKVLVRPTARAVALAFVQAMGTHGIPDEVLSDNGVQFTGRFLRPGVRTEVLFERVCRENGITQRFTRIASPTTTGKVERIHQTLGIELLADHKPFSTLDEAQGALDAWRRDYNEVRPHQSLDMATPATRFVPRPETITDLVVPPELGVVAGERIEVIAPKDEGAHFDDLGLDPESVSAVEFSRVVPPSGNIGFLGQQIWIGPKSAGATVELWADTTSVHVSLAGTHLKTVPSRLSETSLRRLLADGGRPAGPSPRGPAAVGLRAADADLELDRTVNGNGLVAIGGRQYSVGLVLAGERVRIWLIGDIAHIVDASGHIVRTFACALEPARRQRLQGARLAEGRLKPSIGPLVVSRRVSPSGTIMVGGQCVRVGHAHRRKVVEVFIEHAYLRISHAGTTLKVVPRASTREVRSFRASRPPYVS